MTPNSYLTTSRIISCLSKINFGLDKVLSPELKELASSINSENDLKANILDNQDLTAKEKASVCFKLFLGNQEPYFLYQAGNLSSEYCFIAWVLKSLLNEDFDSCGTREKIEQKWNANLTEAFFDSLELTREDIELFYDLIPISRISTFYQAQKQHDEEVIACNGWYKNDLGIDYDQTEEIGEFKGGTLYGCINPKFEDISWHNALVKGFAKTAEGTVIPPFVVEVISRKLSR